MHIVRETITVGDLRTMSAKMFGNMVKAVVDVRKGIMAVDGELQSDEEALLLQEGSGQEDLWGINLYPDLPRKRRIEFDSIINLKPSRGNRSRDVESPEIREQIVRIVNNLVRE